MIKQPWLLVISGLALVVFLYYVVDRLAFLARAERTTGRVCDVLAANGRCGGSKRKYDCTRYTAVVNYSLKAGGVQTFTLDGGNKRGHSQPVAYSSRRVGSTVRVVASPDGSRAYENSLFGVWGTPIIALIVQLASFFASMTEPKQRSGTRSYR